MKLGVNARSLSVDEPGGGVQSSQRLVQACTTREEIEVTLFGHQSLKDNFPACKVVNSGFPLNIQTYGLAWEQIVLPMLAERSDIDVLLFPNGNGVFRSVNVPVVTIVHDIFAYDGYASSIYGALQRVRVPRIIKAADILVTVSEYSKTRLVESFDIDKGSVTVVPNGIDDLFLGDDPGTPVDAPDRYLLFVGGLNDRKNIDGLFSTVDELHDRGREIPLLLAGPTNKRIYDSVSLNERPKSQHLGFVPARELKYLYQNASVFLFPSYREGFGVPPLEAMACGTPVVASDRPALPEVLGDAAVYEPPDDPNALATAVEEILDDEHRRETMKQAGRKRSEQYSWNASVEKLSYVLKEEV